MTRNAPIQGFTLVETLVAIAILMIAIVGPYYSVQQAITASYASRDQLIASSLAQEGAEYIYFLRDNNYLANAPWTQGMDPCLVSMHSNGCTVDPVLNSLVSCAQTGCPVLNLNSATALYTQSSGDPTRFTRTVKIVNVTPQQIQVTVQVNWSSQHNAYTTLVTENLYNWL